MIRATGAAASRTASAGLRIAILRAPGFAAPADAVSVAAVEDAATLLAGAGASVEDAPNVLPDTRAIFSRVWGVALARLVQSFPAAQRALLDPGLLQVAASAGDMTAIEFLDAEAMRVAAAPRHGAAAPALRPGALPDRAAAGAAGGRDDRRIRSTRCGGNGRRGPSPST